MKNIFLICLALLAYVVGKSQNLQLENNTNWFRNGPYSGHVRSLAIAPSNHDIIYIGTYASGVYKTTNGGDSWTFCSTENLPEWEDSLLNSPTLPCWWFGDYYPIDDIAVDPQNSEHLWISTLERGLYESTDGGNSWQKGNETLPDTLAINLININTENPDDIILGTGKYFTVSSPQNGGLYRTLDGGTSWELIEDVVHGSTYYIRDIKRDPTDTDHIIVGFSSAGEPDFPWGLLESLDNGNSWLEVNNNIRIHDISINPENNQNMWGVVYTGYMEFLLEFSEDGGITWELYEGFDDPYKWVTSLYADADFNLYIERQKEDTIGTEIKKSTDNGLLWSTLENFPAVGEGGFKNRLEADNTNTDNIYFGTFYGIYYSEDGGITTQLKNVGLMSSYIRDLEVHPGNSNIIYAGGDQGLWKSIDGGHEWLQIMDEYVNSIEFNPINHDTLYYGGSSLCRSYNGGLTFENIKQNVNGGIMDIDINPSNTAIIYIISAYAYNCHIYKTYDYGDSWELLLTSGCGGSLVIDLIFPDTLYFGTHRSIDGGLTWEENAMQTKIVAVHPDNTDILYGSDGNNIKVSYEWGNSFQLIAEYLNGPFPGHNIRNFTISKYNTDYLFYCTLNNGIYYSSDAGANWQQLEGSYEKRTLDIIPLIDKNKFYIATHGDGVWVYDTTSVNIIGNNLFIKDNNYLQVFPNPSQDKTKITYKIEESANITISIYDIHGKLMKTLINEKKIKGEYEIIWKGKDKNRKEVNSGIYLVHLQSGKYIQTKRLIIIK